MAPLYPPVPLPVNQRFLTNPFKNCTLYKTFFSILKKGVFSMWRLITFAFIFISLLGSVYVAFRFHKLDFVKALARRHPILAWLLSFSPLAVSACFLLFNTFTFATVLIHFVVIWAISDLVGLLIRKLSRRAFRRYYAGLAALAATVIWLSAGWFCAHHVFLTRYTFTSDKLAAPLRVALVADSHLGITQNGQTFARELERLEKEHPDALLLAGDFVDDDSSKEDMLAACDALGRFSAPVCFIYGNHDKGYYRYRNFSTRELADALQRNNVTLLEDAAALLREDVYIIGRQDRTAWGRASMPVLTADLDAAKYMILLDHQPNDYANEAAAQVDLVLSGHTHGGHIFPTGQIGLLIGANDRRYGTEKRGVTQFVVTSGISGWAVPFKTGCWSETVIIDIIPE